MNGYICMYRGKRIDVEADTSLRAQEIAAKAFKTKKSYEVDVYLAEIDGKPVTQTITN
jgi:hypothetical protein